MRFNAREDIEAPIDVVFARVTEFEQFERQALRRGATVKRLNTGEVTPGAAWDIAFTYRGKERRLHATLVQMDAPNFLQVDSKSSGIHGETTVELVPLSPRQTRLALSINLSAKTIPSRLVLQSLKLARGTLVQRLKRRVGSFADDVAERHRLQT